MAPDRGLASSSEQKLQGDSPSCESHREHEVFLSHSGKQKKFVHGLFKEFLNYERFRLNKPFFDVKDHSLRKGEAWISPLIRAARECKVAVLILTEDFLTSKWPMLELLHFIDARKTANPDIKLLPVFFDGLVPAHLSDGECWREKWEKMIAETGSSAKRRQVSLTVESCLEALHILKEFNGIKDGPEFESFEPLQKYILSKVVSYLPSGYGMDPDVVGYDRLCKTISGMFQKREEIDCLGLYGMGGLGKTTMCSALCRYFGPSFNEKVYHLQMGSYKRKNLSYKEVYENRQKELLRKLFRLSEEDIDRIRGDCKMTLKLQFEKEPVFLAIDDIRDKYPESWEEARTYMSYLCPGSKIIFTARSQKILKNIGNAIHCEHIPNLNEEEALSLFFKIAAPERKLTSLDENEDQILRACLRISFFPVEETGGSTDNSHHVPTEIGHYHPLALRAIAFYFRKQNSNLDNIKNCGIKLLRKKEEVFHSNVSDEIIFEVLGIGFQDLDHMTKQLFIDVALYALYAPRQDNGEDIFNWLLDINQFSGGVICRKLQDLREMSFLNYQDREIQGSSTCVNISMHDLYREYAKKLVNKHENEDSYKYGVYNNDHYAHAPPLLASSGWKNTPRIHLQGWKDAINVKEWCCVSVIHLIDCKTITTFSIEPELKNLRELKIYCCSKLEQLQWAPDIISERRRGESKLCYVELRFNERLKVIPDFSDCSQLRDLTVVECSTAVEPISLDACSSLRVLHIAGENAPEVRSLRSCLKLESVQLTWKASHTGLFVSNLPSLLNLIITGAAVLPKMVPLLESIVPHGPSLFRQQHPNETVRYEVTGISQLTNLNYLGLNYIPLGCLPEGLNTLGSSLEYLNLSGCLLSEVVDFSDISSLRQLSIAQTNVREIRGMSGLKKLKLLDCRFNYRLQTIPDLRPAARLQSVFLDQCPEMTAIPRLPASCLDRDIGSFVGNSQTLISRISMKSMHVKPSSLPMYGKCWQSSQYLEFGESTEDDHRKLLAFLAFTKTTKSVIPSPLFALSQRLLGGGGTTRSPMVLHRGIQCVGCAMRPLTGSRYKLRDIPAIYDLCQKCLSNKTHRYDCNFDAENSSPGRFRFKRVLEVEYDLCHECFRKSDCDERDFYTILRTIR